MIAYWWSKEDGTSKYLTVPAVVGIVDVFSGTPVPCDRGLHASPTPWDGLQDACGPVMWEVEIPDDAVPHGRPTHVWAGTWRKYLRRVDMTRVLRRFAAQQARGVMHLWDPPAVVREYLNDESSGKDRADIRNDAWDAACAASKDTLWNATHSDARAAAKAATHSDARVAAWTVTGIAAWAAAWAAAGPDPWVREWARALAAARDAAKTSFNEMAMAEMAKG